MLFVYKFIEPPYHYTYGSVHSMYRVRYQPVGVTGMWVGGRIGVAPPMHGPVDTVEATASSGTSSIFGRALSASGETATLRYDAASPMPQQATSVRVRTWLMSVENPSHDPAGTVEAATPPSGRDASPIDQQLKRMRVTTRAGAINHTSDNTPIHRDPETDTDGDI